MPVPRSERVDERRKAVTRGEGEIAGAVRARRDARREQARGGRRCFARQRFADQGHRDATVGMAAAHASPMSPPPTTITSGRRPGDGALT